MPQEANQPPTGEMQIRVSLSNHGLGWDHPAVLTELSVEMQGTVAGPPSPIIPLDDSWLSNPTPTFVWQSDVHAGLLGLV